MLKERILKAKQDYEIEKKRKEKEDKEQQKILKKQALEQAKNNEEQQKAAILKAREPRSKSSSNKHVTFSYEISNPAAKP